MNMNPFLKRVLAIFALAFAVATSARATATDLWWNANESGWGVNVVQQADILFLTFFVYGPSGQPLWLVAPSTQEQSAGADRSVTFSGPLYQTTGPWLGGAFNPASVVVTPVGSVTFVHLTQTTASLVYTVNGTTVTKALTRMTWRSNVNVPGNYLGALTLTRTGCSSGPASYQATMQFSVTMSGSTIRMSMQPSGGGTCTATGPYVQEGSQGRFEGTVTSCANGASGVGGAKVIEASDGISGRFYAAYEGGCMETGAFAGVFLN
jgi:hypothetical protein